MYYFQFRVSPKPNTRLAEESGGAYANCWVNSRSEEKARLQAEEAIHYHGWVVEELEESERVTRKSFKDNPEALESYDLAKSEGSYFVYNEWPPGFPV